MTINENETIEDLQLNGLKIIQKKDGFRFGLDAVLLSDFAKDIKSNKTLDLCTGSGIIPILLSAKSKAEKLYGIEIQEQVYDIARRSVILNNLEDRIEIINGDIKNADFPKHSFDLITCNPPYMPMGAAIKNPKDEKTIARHEILCNLEDVISVSEQLLSYHGFLALVHKPTRLSDIIWLMKNHNIEPKKIRFVHKTKNSEPCLVLVCGSYKGGIELRILPPLILTEDDGSDSEEVKRIYGI